jgi:hypothetical protein
LSEEELQLAHRDVFALKKKLITLLLPVVHNPIVSTLPLDTPARVVDPPAFRVNAHDDAPQPPSRVDISSSIHEFSPKEEAHHEVSECSVWSHFVDNAVRDAFHDVERLLDQSVCRMEVDIAEKYLRQLRPECVEKLKVTTQSLIEASKDSISFHSAQATCLRRVYNATRTLCSAGRRVRMTGDTLQPLQSALEVLREALIESRELSRMICRLQDDQSVVNWLALPRNEPAMDDISGKPLLAFPWHHVLVSNNFYAGMLEKPPITLQFIYQPRLE